MKKEEPNKLICGLSIELLSAYLDNELEGKDRRMLEAHLQVCTECKKEIERLRGVDEILKGQVIEEPSTDFVYNLNKKIMARIESPKRLNIPFWLPVMVPGIAVVLIVILLNYPKPPDKVGMEHRLVFTEIKTESSGKAAIELEIPTPVAERFAYARSEEKIKKSEKSKPPEAPTMVVGSPDKTEGLTLRSELSKEKIVRAIVDSTGRVLKVATGVSIIPEKDTTLEKHLQGKQLAPPTVRGKTTQMFVDFIETKKDSN
ncbi:MAG: anti-sigma factor [candidate division WOR-3 bacterium]